VIGDGVVVTGMVEEFDGSDDDWADTLTEIDFSLSGDSSLLPGNNVDLPVPTVVAAADLVDAATAEEWEGVLVRIEDVTVVEADLGFGEWSVTGGARVDDQIFEYVPTAGEGFASITGVLTYNYGTYKIVPRDAADLVAAR
jgi:predicted extracellular nuclease